MKKLSVFALVAALVGSACGGGGTFGPVTEIDQTKTLFITLDLPSGAAESPDPDFNTSCRNPGDAIGSGSDVDSVLEDLIDFAYDQDFGVIHLCAGEYVTNDVIEFDNLGSITIQGDGVGETIISGTGGTPHPLLFMTPFLGEGEGDDTLPSNFNVLTLKDLTFTGGDATGEAYDGAIVVGGAVTAPLISTERVEFSDNAGVCGGAIALYGWTIATASNDFLLELDEDTTPEEALNAFLVFDTANRSQISDTTFRNNSAVFGGAIAGAGADIPVVGEAPPLLPLLGYLACQNPGPLEISGSLFEDNSSVAPEGEMLFLESGGGAIASIDSRVFMLYALALELEEELDSIWLSEATSAWLASDATDDPWLTVTETSFNGNHANVSGGAIAAVGNVVITNSSFTDNYVEDDDVEFAGNGAGGALLLSGALTLTKSKFIRNSASTGGAIMIQGLFGDDLTLTRNTFTRNTATDQGGAIYGWSADGVARGNRFTWNRAPIGSAVAVPTERCSRSVSRREARDWRGNMFRKNRGGRLPVECFAFAEPT